VNWHRNGAITDLVTTKTQKFQENQNMRYGPKAKQSSNSFWIHQKIHIAIKAFAPETVDLNHVSERIQAAFSYFLKPMDDLVFEILWKIEEVKRIKGKDVYEELIVRRGTNQSRSA
jgi:hypothetical protein